MTYKNELIGTGSVAVQVINDRVSVVWSPTGPKSNPGPPQTYTFQIRQLLCLSTLKDYQWLSVSICQE